MKDEQLIPGQFPSGFVNASSSDAGLNGQLVKLMKVVGMIGQKVGLTNAKIERAIATAE